MDLTAIISTVPSLSDIRVFKGHIGYIFSTVFLTEDLMATASQDNSIRVWDVKSGVTLKVITEHANSVHCIIVSPNRKYLASGGKDKKICVFEISGEYKCLLSTDCGKFVRTLCFADDHNIIAGVEGSNIFLINVLSGIVTKRHERYEIPSGIAVAGM